MKPTPLLILALTAQIIHAQDVKHESNGDDLKLSLEAPGVKGSATAGGAAAEASTEIPSGPAPSVPGKPAIPNLPTADYIRSTPEPGTSGGYRESTVSLEHNGKSVKVTRRPSRTGGDEVIVTTKAGGKEKVEVMTPAEYEQQYLRKKGARQKPPAEETPAKADLVKDPSAKRKGNENSDGRPAPTDAPAAREVETEINVRKDGRTNDADSKSDASSESESAGPGKSEEGGMEVPAAPKKVNRATE